MYNNYIDQIRKFKDDFDQTVILSRKGFSFNQRQLIDLIDKYWNDEFITGDKDDEGYMYFYNKVKLPTRVSAKLTDFDTKDIRFIAEDGQSHVPVYLFNKELKAWMKDQGFGRILNEINAGVPRYGTFVLKVIGDEIKSVRLQNIVNDPHVEKLNDSSVIIEQHEMTPEQLMGMKGKWDGAVIDELISEFQKNPTGSSYINVSEIYLYAPRNFFDESSSKEDLKRGLCIVANLDNFELKDKRKTKNLYTASNYKFDDHKILFKAIKDPSYYEFFWDEFDGNWLRCGVVQELLEEQFRTNITVNEQARGLAWTSKKLYQTKDMLVQRNLFKDVQNGDIIRVNSEITPIANEERNLAAFNSEIGLWDKNTKEKTLTFEAITGETLPSGTPFRLGFIQQQAASGYFDVKRENIGLQIRALIYNVIAPTFLKSKRTKHLFNFYGEDTEFQQMEDLYIEMNLYKQLKDFIIKTGSIPNEVEIEQERQKMRAKFRAKPRVVEIPEGFYGDLKYKIDILITNEQVDINAKVQTATTLLQTISTNPGILQDPVSRRLLMEIADLSGISPEKLKVSESVNQQQQMMQQQAQIMQQQTFSPPPKGGAPAQLQSMMKQTNV